jgi:hypothetical protein
MNSNQNNLLQGGTMTKHKPLAWLLVLVGAILLSSGLLLATATPVTAQCGSDASSCKTCHEVNGEFPVADLGAWHADHSFEDYCVNCHLGDDTTGDKNASHTGIIEVLADTETACATCHADNYDSLAAGYAEELASYISAAPAAPVDPLAVAAADDPLAVGAADDPLAVAAADDPLAVAAADAQPTTVETEIIDDEPSNTGNQILVVLAEGLLVFGGGLIWFLERRK